MISGFVLVMMLVIEYVNVLSRGWVQERLVLSGWPQLVAAAFLGAMPGCLGAYTVVALYSHGAVSLGALVAAMIATSGDEAFVLFAAVPRTALPLSLGLLALGLLAGRLTDRIAGRRLAGWLGCCDRLEMHEPQHERFSLAEVPAYFRRLSFPRALLLGGTLLIILGILSGALSHDHAQLMPQHGHEHEASGDWGWIRVTFLLVALVALFIVTTVPEHFLEEHLYRHVVRRHLPALLLWTFAALLTMAVLQRAVRPEAWLALHPAWLTLSAGLVGIIPESGPHLFYVTGFARGLVPLAALVVSSIVQDGHGMLPLLAESRRAFLLVKGINLLVGLVVGAAMLLFGT